MFYTHALCILADASLHPSTLYHGTEVTFSPNMTKLPFMCDQVTTICLPVPCVQSSFFPVWFLRHFWWSSISEIQHTHIIKHWSTENKNLKPWVQNPSVFLLALFWTSQVPNGKSEDEVEERKNVLQNSVPQNLWLRRIWLDKQCSTVTPEFNAWSQPLSLDKRVQIQLTVSNFSFHLLHTCRNKQPRNPSFLQTDATGKPFIHSFPFVAITHTLYGT
jgi:hypothetical protein